MAMPTTIGLFLTLGILRFSASPLMLFSRNILKTVCLLEMKDLTPDMLATAADHIIRVGEHWNISVLIKKWATVEVCVNLCLFTLTCKLYSITSVSK